MSVIEAASGSVEVTDISDAHLHPKTVSGPITLTDIRNSHLDVHSVSGDVSLGRCYPAIGKVNSGSGRIRSMAIQAGWRLFQQSYPATSKSRSRRTPGSR